MSDPAATAKRLIDAKGRSIEIVYFDDSAPTDPTKPYVPGTRTETRVATKGVFLASNHVKYGLGVDEQSDDYSVHGQERRVLIPALGLSDPPNVKCELISRGERWKIMSVESLNPGDQDILYTLQVRR